MTSGLGGGAVSEPLGDPGKVLRQRRCRRAGAAIVEFAFVAPVLFLIVLGIFELGRIMMVNELLIAAARVGARVAIVPGKGAADVSTAVNDYLTSVGISGDVITIYVNDAAIGGTDTLASATPGTEVTVKIVVPVTRISWVPARSFSNGNITGQFTMRRQ